MAAWARIAAIQITARSLLFILLAENKSGTGRSSMAKKILVADDDPSILISLEFLLRREGYEVGFAKDGAEALVRLRAERPDMAILDVMMPLRNGFEVCQDLRQDPLFKDLRIMMLTAKTSDTDISKGQAFGADVYMTKPFSTRELIAKVKTLIDREPPVYRPEHPHSGRGR
jgi:DNA-binding response OmpR family regulator